MKSRDMFHARAISYLIFLLSVRFYTLFYPSDKGSFSC